MARWMNKQPKLTNGGMTHALAGAAAAQGDVVKHGHIVTNDSCLPYDDAGRMVHQNPTPNAGGRVDVHLHHLRHPTLQGDGQRLQSSSTLLSVTAEGLPSTALAGQPV